MVQRRTFIRTLALASVATVIETRPLSATTRLLAPSRTSVAGPLSFETFASLRGSTFALQAQDGSGQSCVLANVERYDRGSGIENFSLRFDGAAASALPQGTHRFTHSELGDFELFVVAKQLDAQTCGYEAVFNRLA